MRWPRNKDQLFALLVILPSLVLVTIFVYGFIGLDNYRELFTGLIDSRFRQDLVNTIFFTLFFITGCLGLGLALAILLDRKPKGENALRTIFLFPMSLSFIVTGTIWRWLLQPQGGVNRLPTLVGLPPGRFAWLTSRQQILRFDWNRLPFYTALVVAAALVLVGVSAFRARARARGWVALSSAAILAAWAFTLGLRGVPDELREAARVDGATEFQLYRRVILPLLAPITLSAVIILSMPGFVVVIIWQFTQIWNEFLFAVTLSKPASQPITVALAQLAGREAVKWNLPMAGALLAALPTLIVYVVFGRYFIRGLLAGSIKG